MAETRKPEATGIHSMSWPRVANKVNKTCELWVPSGRGEWIPSEWLWEVVNAIRRVLCQVSA